MYTSNSKSYANLFSPPLENKINAIIFENFIDLDIVINEIFKLNVSEINELRKNVLDYNKKHLVPAAIVKKIEKNAFQKIFIQAELSSLKYLKESA